MKSCTPERLSTPASVIVGHPASSLTQPISRAIRQTDRSVPAEFDLPAGALWSSDPRAGLEIRCVSGDLWVTQAGNGQDIVLSQGESFPPAPRGRIVVQVLSDSRIRVVRD